MFPLKLGSPWWKNRSYLSLITCSHLTASVFIPSLSHTLTSSNPLITMLMHPFWLLFQGYTTASPAPLQEPVLSLLLVTSSSAPASSTQCASPAVTHLCVMDHARRNDPNHPLPSPWPRRSSLCFLSTSSSYCPPLCADRPWNTELRCVLKMFCCWQRRQHELDLYCLRQWRIRTLKCIFFKACGSFVQYLFSWLPGFLSQLASKVHKVKTKTKTTGKFYHHVCHVTNMIMVQLPGELGKVRWRTVQWTKQLLAILLGSRWLILICLYLLTLQGQLRHIEGKIVSSDSSCVFWALGKTL